MRVLGISAYYHDSAAVLVDGERIVAAAQEERFSRRRHDAAFPLNAIASCLAEGGVQLGELDAVAFYDKPLLKFERLLETYLAFAPRGFRQFRAAIPAWLREKLLQKSLLAGALREIDATFDARRLLFSEHHLSHAASAFYPSPFDEAVILTLDGVGEWATATVAVGRGRELRLVREQCFPHSLGLLYSAFTAYTGFKVNSGEYKLMGLAPYGRPRYARLILDRLIDLKPDGSFRVDMRYFDYCTGLRMTNRRFHDLFGGPPRNAEDPLEQRHMDLAASIQEVTEQILLRLTRALAADPSLPRNLCLAGGVALNCVANGKILRDGRWQGLWVQPAAGDAGGALGAALAAAHLELGLARRERAGSDSMMGSYLGPQFSQPEIDGALRAAGAVFRTVSEGEVLDGAARSLAAGRALGWFSGRMEFGPRALGARSILADPRSPTTQSVLNLKIKHRESFRPFAPSVLREDAHEWFDLAVDSPYMLLVADVRASRRRTVTDEQEQLFGIERLNIPRSEIPAVTHVDWSARVQTVDAATNPRYHALLSRFKEITGCPVLVNTSFNVRGEPIVCTPADAFRCFMGTEIDDLAIGNAVLRKEDQAAGLRHQHHTAFALD